MNKKLIIQIILILLTIILLKLFFSNNFEDDNKNESKNENLEITNDKKERNQNIIKDIKYTSKDNDGNSYLIYSDYGKINIDKPDLIFMTNVTAIINLKDTSEIKITSKFANFNNKSFETEFYEKVVILRENEKITSQRLEFSLEKNLVLLSNDVIFNKSGFNLKADKVEIDLITKDSKILMNDENKKVIAVGKIK
tara:strand:+ start:1522 stop:2109 length:588 start_codon:yes stop_codon:yes gene_type:complete